jgi:tetratricopeptide (TPR) repeat protein
LAVAWQLRATASVWMGQHRKAIDQVGRAMRLNPKDPDIFRSEHTMATALLLEGMKDEAIPWAKRMLANYPNWPPGLWMAACVFAHAGYIDDARKVAKHLCTRVPDMTISRFKSTTVFRRPSDVKLIVEGLRLSGLPE